MSLPKKNRLNKGFFKKPQKKEGFFTSKNLTLKTFINTLSTQTFSVVVSSKELSRATERNLLKRRIKESIKIAIKNNKKPVKGVFYTKKGIEQLSFKELSKEIKDLIFLATK